MAPGSGSSARFPAAGPLRGRRADFGVLAVTGADRSAFLTRIMSGNLPPAPGTARTALLGPKGNLIAAAVATVTGEAVFLECERVREEALLRALDRYRIADRVEIRPAGGGGAVLFRLDGGTPDHSGAARAVPGLEEPEWAGHDLAEPDLAEPGRVRERPRGYLRRDFRPWPAFVFCSAEAGTPPPEGFRADAVREADPEEQEYLRILAGEPRWGAELDETSLPLAAGLAAHVRLGKGCYIGQEYVARQAHRGRVRRLLRILEMQRDEVPEPGADIVFEKRSVGRITSAAARPDGWPAAARPVALATLAAEVAPGAVVEIPAEPARTAKVVALPAT